MNWGHKIIIIYVVFIAGIVFMVFRSATQKTDLVTTDYYAKELKYQEKIDQMNRVSALSLPVICEVQNDTLLVRFPSDFAGKRVTGEAHVYRPSDEKKDIKKTFSLQDEVLMITLPVGASGLYELHLSWQEGGVTYYFEKKIFI